MTRDFYDLLIVGAGPGGTMAGYCAARAGLKVLLIDKHEFPRIKACAGGLTPKSLNIIPFDLDPVVENAVRTISLEVPSGKQRILAESSSICTFVERAKFDDFMLAKARAAGVAFRVVGKLTEVEIGSEKVRLRTPDEALSARYVLCADGANSRMRRLVNVPLPQSHGFALEGKIREGPSIARDRMILKFNQALQGYQWVFPKEDHLNVGLYTMRADRKLSKRALFDAFPDLLENRMLEDVLGFPIRFGGDIYAQHYERVLFAGDAAGMAEPLLGEGIHNALKSGKIAGELIADSVLSGRAIGNRYIDRLRPIQRDLKVSRWIARFCFYPHLRHVGAWAITSERVSRRLTRGFASGKTLAEILYYQRARDT